MDDKEKLLAQLGQLTIDIAKLQQQLRQKQIKANEIATQIEGDNQCRQQNPAQKA